MLVGKIEQEGSPQDKERDDKEDNDNERGFVRTLWWWWWWYRSLHVVMILGILGITVLGRFVRAMSTV
jgi:hypothetical protein